VRRRSGLLPAALLLALVARAAATPEFSLDAALVRPAQADSGWQLDVMLGIERASLPWNVAGERLEAHCPLRVTLVRGGATIADTSLVVQDVSETDAVPPGQKLPLLVSLPVDAGSLRLVVELQGQGDTARRDRRLTVPPSGEGPVLSGMRLSVSVPEPATSGPFRHRGLRCVPYADLLYNERLSVIHGFIEGYDLPEGGVQYSLRLLDSGQYLVRELERRPGLPAGRTLLPIQVPVHDLPSGAWMLEARLEDEGGRALAQSRKPFWTLNPGVTQVPGRLEEDEFETLTVSALQDLWERSSLLADPHEQVRWENADLPERRVFLKEFWQRRDPEPRTRRNEGLEDFQRRVEEADRLYGTSKRAGWNTDRGRTLVRHGAPPEVDDNQGGIRFERLLSLGVDGGELLDPSGEDPFSDPAPGQAAAGLSRLAPFEIWYYPELRGGAVFIFVDEGGYGDYRLAHSTLSGEYFDPSWPRRLLGGRFLERGR
jgi:GWxTD domain-containing protein